MAQKLAFNQRTLAGDYQRVGRRNPKWDAAAETFLADIARYFARAGEPVWYQIEFPKAAELLAQSARLVDQMGCDDPLVLYCHAALLMDESGSEEQYKAAQAKAVEAYQRLRGSDYNAFRKASAAKRASRILTTPGNPWHGQAVVDQAQRDAFDFDVACFTSDAFKPEEARVLLASVWEPRYSGNQKAADLKPFVDAIAGSQTQPWAVQVVRGEYHVTAAWESRGFGFAHTVTPEGWAGFKSELTKAAQLLEGAHRRHPDRPEAATAMITVAMGGHAPRETDPQYWFERAIRAQLDHEPAWTKLSTSLLPRWGGSHEAMLELGLFALSTERYDTGLPTRLVTQVKAIADDADGNWEAVRVFGPRVWHDLKRMYEHVIPALAARGTFNASHYAAQRLSLAWALGQWQDAAALLAPGGEMGGVNSRPYHTQEFANVGIPPEAAIAEIAARTGPHAKAITQAETREKAPDRKAAEAAWKDLLAQMPADAPGRAFVESRVREHEFLRRLEEAPEGQWVDVPTDLAFWEVLNGDWRVDEADRFIATTKPDRRTADPRWGRAVAQPTIVFLPRMPDAFEVQATLGVVNNAKGEPCPTGLVGLRCGWGAFGTGVYVNRRVDGLEFVDRTGRRTKTNLRTDRAEPVVRLDMVPRGSADLYVNDHLRIRMQSGEADADPTPAGSRRLALTCNATHLDDVFYIHTVQVRRPNDEPPEQPRRRAR